MRFAVPIPPSQSGHGGILRILQSKGAGEVCYVISEDSEFDGKKMVLEEALSTILGRGMGTLLSCIKGALGYFEDEDQRWILERKGKC